MFGIFFFTNSKNVSHNQQVNTKYAVKSLKYSRTDFIMNETSCSMSVSIARYLGISLAYSLSPPSAAYMRQWTGPALVQVMACRLFSAKPLPQPTLAYCQLDSWEQISVKFESEFYNFDSRKCIWKCRRPEWRPFCPGGDELNQFKWTIASTINWLHRIYFPFLFCYFINLDVNWYVLL